MGGADRVDRSEEGKDVSDYSSWPRVSQTKNTNMKLLCKLFMVCKTLVEVVVFQASKVQTLKIQIANSSNLQH